MLTIKPRSSGTRDADHYFDFLILLLEYLSIIFTSFLPYSLLISYPLSFNFYINYYFILDA